MVRYKCDCRLSAGRRYNKPYNKWIRWSFMSRLTMPKSVDPSVTFHLSWTTQIQWDVIHHIRWIRELLRKKDPFSPGWSLSESKLSETQLKQFLLDQLSNDCIVRFHCWIHSLNFNAKPTKANSPLRHVTFAGFWHGESWQQWRKVSSPRNGQKRKPWHHVSCDVRVLTSDI